MKSLLAILYIALSISVSAQIIITGEVVDANTGSVIAYANIGIKQKNVGTVSKSNGTFILKLAAQYLNDTITFSMVGYYDANIPIHQLDATNRVLIRLREKTTELLEVAVYGEKMVERKYGIKKRGLIHFTDGMFEDDDSFEIGQVVQLGKHVAQITSVNLHLNVSRNDSANFRIRFYRYDEDTHRPAERIVERNILSRHAINVGWLSFDLTPYNILLRGKVFVAIEFIPENKPGMQQIIYEVKLGGASKSYYRRNSLGQWNAPPHHYCVYVTALVDKHAPEEADDIETLPAFTLRSQAVKDSFSIFVRLPRDYGKNSDRKYPVVYHLDGNAYFDLIGSSIEQLSKKRRIPAEPILVGIGYKNAYRMDSLRNRDYTFPEAPAADSLPTSGGGEKFYQFLSLELKPLIDKKYRTDVVHNTLMGHSLGGYFVLYALSKNGGNHGIFDSYVAASPSLGYGDHYIFSQFLPATQQNKTTRKPTIYLTTGELELKSDADGTFAAFQQLLRKQNHFLLKTMIYKNLEHMGTAVPSFEDGMKIVLDLGKDRD